MITIIPFLGLTHAHRKRKMDNEKRIAAVALSLLASTTLAATPTAEEMWAAIQQQAEIANLKAQLATTDEEIKETAIMAETTAVMVE